MKKVILAAAIIIGVCEAVNHISDAIGRASDKVNDTITKAEHTVSEINEIKETIKNRKLREAARKVLRSNIVRVFVINGILASCGLAALYTAVEMYNVYTGQIEAAVAMSDGNLLSLLPLCIFAILAIILYIRAKIQCKKNNIDIEEDLI